MVKQRRNQEKICSGQKIQPKLSLPGVYEAYVHYEPSAFQIHSQNSQQKKERRENDRK